MSIRILLPYTKGHSLNLTSGYYQIKVFDQKERATRRRTVKSYKVQWSNHSEEEATWEKEDYLQAHYP